MGGPEVEAFFTWLADQCQVATTTHKQALSALLFLYTKVLEVNLPWLPGSTAHGCAAGCLLC
jgi:hypothetical protein